MAAVRLGHLALRLQAPASLRASAPALQSDAATGFVPALLHALGDRLQQACGREALIRIRALRLRVSMPVAGLDAAAWIDSVSADLADQVLQTVRRERGGGQRPAPGASMQVFKDRAHETACRWCDAAERAAGEPSAQAAFERCWAEVRAAPDRELAAVLAHCAACEGLDAVLARLPAAELGALRDRLARGGALSLQRAVGRALAARAGPASRRGSVTSGKPDTEPPAGAGPRGPTSMPGVPSDDRPSPAADAAANEVPAQRATRATGGQDDSRARPAARVPRRAAPAAPAAPPATHVDEKPAVASRPPAPSAPSGPDAPPAEGATVDTALHEPIAGPGLHSRWCALMYLVNVSLRLELPERLWQLGLDEGASLAAMMARLCGDAGDPVATVLASTHPVAPAPLPTLAPWARDEIEQGLWAAIDRWPAVAAQRARLRQRLPVWSACFAPNPPFDLAAWLAAAHLAIAEVLLDDTLAPGALAARWGMPGTLQLLPDTILVCQPMDAIDLSMRRAGLDRDPGWLPWRGKRLGFVFADAGDAG